MILDAGFFVSVDRGEPSAQEFLTAAVRQRTPLHSTHPVVAQVWRDGARQARLSRVLRGVTLHPFDDGAAVGALLARARSSDVVDAHLVVLALALNEPILTGDMGDLRKLAAALPSRRPRLFHWPPA